MTEERFLTFATVGIMLGSSEQPLGRQFLNRLIDRGDLIDNGLPHKARRISRKSVLALLQRMEEGTCQVNENDKKKKTPMGTGASMKIKRVAAGGGSFRSATGNGKLDALCNELMQIAPITPR